MVVLTDENFDEIVYNSNKIWFIVFYAPWGGHCKKLLPQWEIAAESLQGRVKFGKVDATAQEKLHERFGIWAYPTPMYWKHGPCKSDQAGINYEGERSSEVIQHRRDTLRLELLYLELDSSTSCRRVV